MIGGLFFPAHASVANREQIILVEMLSELLARDYTYVVYHPCDKAGLAPHVLQTVAKQGFRNIAPNGARPIYAVDMRSPVIIFKNADPLIKHPLNKRPAVLSALEQAHDRLLRILTEIYPSELVLSYNSDIMYHKMIHLIARINRVSPTPYETKSYGEYMAVPFGKVLEGSAVPNTVTKALHTEKYFYEDLSGFTIEEKSYYSTLENQIRTIKSFNRPVILIDDLLDRRKRAVSVYRRRQPEAKGDAGRSLRYDPFAEPRAAVRGAFFLRKDLQCALLRFFDDCFNQRAGDSQNPGGGIPEDF